MRQKNDYYRQLAACKLFETYQEIHTDLKTAEKHYAKLKSQIFE